MHGAQFSLEQSGTVGSGGGKRYEALFVFSDTDGESGESFEIHVLASEDSGHNVTLWDPKVKLGNVEIVHDGLTAESGQTGDDDDELDD